MRQYKAQVKLIDEFIARFNRQERREDVLDINNDTLQLQLLCDGVRYMSDSVFRNNCDSMILAILKNDVSLNYSDLLWYAKAICDVRYENKNDSIEMLLSVEQRHDDLYKWVIADVKGDILDLGAYGRSPELYIMPNQHEMNFMELPKLSKETYKYVVSYTKNSFTYNRLSVFSTMVYLGLLRINIVKSLSFVFMQIPDYCFTVDYFVRDSYNCGWLISDIQKMTEEQKVELYHMIH
ncbi:MAG: hypothetical protein IJ756_05315 [Paludibacteraceae bacterium]|nr:hypothetical protein [Paludibacteraceae bacterium]